MAKEMEMAAKKTDLNYNFNQSIERLHRDIEREEVENSESPEPLDHGS